ncbi:bile salt export pump [Sphaerosporella brunnea]|uniref:Bile salt export pump n=1 Tax=Sphaerosporella brunnea TaxID=1250544 RepID=A0A5J5ERY0_9PEZI|nr:bile salt export pump [Sphaerosporella brunnea]
MEEICLSDLPPITSADRDSFTITIPQPAEASTESFLADNNRGSKVSWRSLFVFTDKRHLVVLTIALLLSVISGLIIPGMSILLGKIFGTFAGFGSGALSSDAFIYEVRKTIAYLALLGCGSWLFNGTFFASWLWFGELQAKAARERLFESLIDQDVEWFDDRANGVSAMLSKSQTQIKELQSALSQPLGYATQSLVTAVVSLAVALYHSWSLTLVILAVVPLALGLLGFLSSKIQPHISKQKRHLECASQTASCSINTIDTVKAFNGQARELDKFSKALDCASREQKSLARLHALQTSLVRLFTFIMFVQGFWYGTALVRGKHHSMPAAIMTTFWSCLMGTQALELIIPQLMFLEKGRGAGAGLNTLLTQIRETNGCYRRVGGYTPLTCKGDIGVAGVSFAYPSRPSELALVDVNLSFPANKTTFIIGKSGSGKSTLGLLILNIYRPLFGNVSIDGRPLSTLDPRWIRDNVSLIQQQSSLFNETIFRNISFGHKNYEYVTQDQVLDVCKMTALEKTIKDLPRGLNTIVGGKQLSGGELQRMAIARDRLRDATILVLDEALGSLDVFSRRVVADAIRKWRHGKTTIIITHDISEIGSDDFAYVMDGGKVVQQGYRRDLESRTGPFQSFVLASDPAKKRRPQRKSQYASLLPELDTHFWNNSPADLGLPSLGEVLSMPDSGGSSSSAQSSPRVSHDGVHGLLPPECIVARDRRYSEGTTLTEFSKISSDSPLHFSSPPSSPTLKDLDCTPGHSDEENLLPKSSRVSNAVSKTSLVHIFSTIWPSLSLHRKLLLLVGLVAALLHAAATPTFSFVLARLLQSILDTRLPETEARKWSLSIIGIAIADSLCCFTMRFLLETCGQRWVDQHRTTSFARILDQSRAWFDLDKNSAATLMEDMEKHAEEMRNLLARFAGYGLVGFALTIIGITWSLVCSWRLTLVGLCIGPVMYGLSRGMGWTSSRYETMCNDCAQVTGGVLYEAIANIRTVRNYRVERYFRNKYKNATKIAFANGIKRSIYTGIWFGLADSSILFGTALVFYYGALLISKAQEDFTNVLSVFTLLLFSLSYANSIVGMIPQISSSKDSALRLLRLSSLPQNSHEHEGSLSFPANNCAITFKDIVFSYPTRPHISILRGLSLRIAAGECLAIVGASGGGKSTLSALLQRLYNPSHGEITIASTPLNTISTHSLREQLAVLSQNPTLFDATIAENITYGLSPTPSIADVIRAAEMAGAHEFITSLPESYDTLLGDSGMGLSDGQAQRVAIARALVRRPRILILDECTSNLDAESARTVKECLMRLVQEERGRMTVIMITHSKELMKAAKRIVVIGDGVVIEDGRYDELMAKGGAFRELLEGHLN